jgi:carboxymethylenebutenolidase
MRAPARRSGTTRLPEEPNTLSRREFTALSIAAGVTAATGATAMTAATAATGAAGAGATPLVESDVQVAAPAGLCDAALIHPQQGSWPGVILFTDVFGLRPTMRGMARRLAAGGFAVLVPNPFYRTNKPPGLSLDIDFNNPVDRAKIDAVRAPLTGEAVMQDAAAYVKFLDSQAAVDRRAKMGVFGYCMGGPMTLHAAAAVPDRIGAGASFHGGGLVTDKPDSPHRLVQKLRARFYVGIAMNDDQRQPDAKSTLNDAFHAANLQAKIEVYDGCLHGWCVKDMPQSAGKPAIYSEAQAERAWGELVSLFKRVHVG